MVLMAAHDTPTDGPADGPANGPAGGLTDVAGLRVGHAHVPGERALSGTTVVLAPAGGAIAAVDVRGGGPGTRETDALDPRNLVQRVEAVVLTGGSAYGLESAAGVMAWLEEQGRGVRVGPDPSQVVPVVPAACVFDLGRGGDWRARPDATTGRAAVEAAARMDEGAPVEEGGVGAGMGAVVGQFKGGVGTASAVLDSGITVAALVVANAAGSAVDPLTGALYGSYFAGRVAYPSPDVHAAAQLRLTEAREKNAPPRSTPPSPWSPPTPFSPARRRRSSRARRTTASRARSARSISSTTGTRSSPSRPAPWHSTRPVRSPSTRSWRRARTW